jgi:hypothetical protein
MLYLAELLQMALKSIFLGFSAVNLIARFWKDNWICHQQSKMAELFKMAENQCPPVLAIMNFTANAKKWILDTSVC